MKTIRVSEQMYPHEFLWRSAKTLQELAISEEKQFYIHISCLTMAYHAFEAFVNFLGKIICPDKWADEKKTFRGKGNEIEAKIAAIVQSFPDYNWRKGEYPYQEIRKLRSFRNFVAHGKTVTSEYTTVKKKDGSHFKWDYFWDEFMDPSNVNRAMDSIYEFCQSLLLEARKVNDEPHLIFNAFDGSLASGSGVAAL